MDILNRLAESIDYIEKHLDQPLKHEEIAQIAYCSKFHYQRMFYMLTGVTLADYIRKRRLTVAAQELAASHIKVVDAAFKYGYNTPESFSKAFSRLHGISPSQAREKGRTLRAFPRLSFHIQIKGVEDMNYKIVEKEPFQVIGKALEVTVKDDQNKKDIPAFWNELNHNGFTDSLKPDIGPLGFLGVCMDFNDQADTFHYVIGVEKTSADTPAGCVEKPIPAATWAVFEAVGPVNSAVQATWERIFSEWFPATGYELANAPQFESYPKDGNIMAQDHITEIWVPVVKQK
ncbi:Regulatory protein SoxS [Bacillus paralicheniformis]|uniref:AraC family transcriptional regulator n=1 Tax=Bacillus paralicheniformis TaxID=1648923 RepID=UPI00046E7DFB|nr:AraC family transcriptional regulator [Bacillus paralicheniformis]MDE1361757.1 AraC family transcriptional regulator [Bacillus paralicheniformis]MEC2097491.1 AraC family transcriptional regulator [Bacillus paralicheniformis]MEC2116095.1 AraC family transcriptional regulator [Bacillus paralicheniformis]MEC2322561.1 AraC family transcriptional regulator [Bacillus paralicheniformis]MED4310253.1 AraC family transcriptional regulator [Bacillus paralicheniformis]